MAIFTVRRWGFLLSLTVCILLFGIPITTKAQDQGAGAEAQRTAWFRQAKFGMFIHWGPYSVASVEASWPIMKPEPQWNITEADYVQLYKRFNPVQFDPRAWVRLAQDAGMRYMVFTTKHHDGFCMFDTALTSYKITKTPYGQDVTAMLARDLPAQVFKRANNLSRSKQRDSGHQTNTSTSRVVTVGGMPSSARTARHSRIASATFDSASASVCPWLTQPGIDGHSAIYAPSSSW